MPDRPVAASKALAKDLQAIEDEHKTGIVQEVNTPAGLHPVPPAVYYERDKRDDYYEAKKTVTEAVEAGEGLGTQVIVTDEDIKYLRDQRTKEELATYDKWFYETFLFGADPNKIALAKEMNPQWFERREQEIKKQVGITKKLAKLGLRGPRSEEELKLIYAIQSGRVEVPNLDHLFPELMKDHMRQVREREARTSIRQGYFNPKQFTSQLNVTIRPFSSAYNFNVSKGGSGLIPSSFADNRGVYNIQHNRLAGR